MPTSKGRGEEGKEGGKGREEKERKKGKRRGGGKRAGEGGKEGKEGKRERGRGGEGCPGLSRDRVGNPRCPEIVIIKLRSCTENDMYRKCAVMEMYLIRPNPMLIPAGRSSQLNSTQLNRRLRTQVSDTSMSAS